MGGCEIPLTDPSVAPLAPNTPFVTIAFRDHLRSGGRTADADPPRAIMLFAYGVQCLVGRQAAIQAAPGSITSKRRLRPGSPVVEVQLLVPQPRWPVLQHQPAGRPVQRRLNQPPDPGGQPCCQVARMARGRSRATGPAFRSVLVNALRGRCPCGRAARSPQARTVTDSVVPANPAWQYLHRSEAIWRCRERSVKLSAQPTLGSNPTPATPARTALDL